MKGGTVMEVLTMDNILNNAILILLVVGTLVLIAKAKKNNWSRCTDIGFVLFFSVAVMCGEIYNNTYGSIPWLIGAEDEMAHRGDLNPVAFLALLAVVVFFIGRALLYKASGIYTNTRWLPGTITPVFASLSIVLIAGYLFFVGGAYIHHSTGATPGHSAVQTERRIIQSGLNLVGDFLSANKSDGDDDDRRNAKQQRSVFFNHMSDDHDDNNNNDGRSSGQQSIRSLWNEPDDDHGDDKKQKPLLRFTSPDKRSTGRKGPDQD